MWQARVGALHLVVKARLVALAWLPVGLSRCSVGNTCRLARLVSMGASCEAMRRARGVAIRVRLVVAPLSAARKRALTVFAFLVFLPQAFKVYMRRRGRFSPFQLDWFRPEDVVVDSSPPTWVDVLGDPASPPLWGQLPLPSAVLDGSALPNFGGLRMRSPDAFRCGHLHQFADQWDSFMTGVRGYDVVRPWIRRGVHLPDFFEHYKGEFKGREFDSAVPPPMYFQNDNERIADFTGFVGKTILTRLREGSIKYLGRVGVDPPPRVVCLLSPRSPVLSTV